MASPWFLVPASASRFGRRALVLDGLLGSSGELTREAGHSCEKDAPPRDSFIS
jgi:hypothetical protein